MGEYILRLVVLVPVIGGLAWLSLWMWKRLQIGMTAAPGGPSRVRVTEIIPMGVGAKLAVLEFAGRDLLISVSKSDIRLLADSHD